MIVFYENQKEKFIYIPHFVVMPEFRHRGVGHFALDKLIKMIGSRYNEIRLEVVKENNTARAFYARENFVAIEERENAYLLTKQLNY